VHLNPPCEFAVRQDSVTHKGERQREKEEEEEDQRKEQRRQQV
jgi:hypothetical protein